MNWRKSSYSGNNGGQCVEVANDGDLMVRDTKDRERGPVLRFTPEAWEAFTRSLKQLPAKQKAGRLPGVGSGRPLLFCEHGDRHGLHVERRFPA